MKRVLGVLLLALPLAASAQNKPARCLPELLAPTGQMHAEQQFGDNTTKYFGGTVRFRCQNQNVFIGADSVQIVNGDLYVLIGHAFYRDTSLSVTADTLTYFKKASNRAQDETIAARVNVVVTDRKTGSTLKGPTVDFLRGVKGVRDSDDVLAGARPVVRYLPSNAPKGVTPKPWTITADHLRGFGQSRLWGGGAVEVDRDSAHVSSDSIDVEYGTLRTTKFIGKPAVLHRIGNDSFTIKGSQIRLGFAGDSLRAVRALGEGVLLRGQGTIKGDSVLLAFEKEKPVRTDVWGKARSATVHSSGYDAEADSIVIETPGGEQLRGLRAFRNAKLVNPRDSIHPVLIDSTQGGSPGRDTLWGNRILASFVERDSAGTKVTRVSLVQAQGKASSFFAYNAGENGYGCPTLTHFNADTIIVRMKSGDSSGVADVQYHLNVVGWVAEMASTTKTARDTSKAAKACGNAK